MTCDCCAKAKESPTFSDHCLTCLYCGARLIQGIQKLPINREAKITRCRKVLADWVAWGHRDAEIRKLASMREMPLEKLASMRETPLEPEDDRMRGTELQKQGNMREVRAQK